MIKNVINEINDVHVLTRDNDLKIKLEGELAAAVAFIERNQICDVGLWQRFVELFRWHKDGCGEANTGAK